MKAARFHAAHDVRLDTIPAPSHAAATASNKVIIEVHWCGICGSDMHEYAHGPQTLPTESHPHPITKDHVPVVFGHEFCGRVVQAPPGSKLEVGQAVMADPRLNCNACQRCGEGNSHACAQWGFLGLSGGGGGFSERVAVEERMLYCIPEEAAAGGGLEFAALIEPLAVAWHALSVAEVGEWGGTSVLILGGGPVGIAVLFVLRARGCRGRVVVSEPTVKRKEFWQGMEGVLVVDPRNEDVGEKCRAITGGAGVDVVFDCAGVQKGMEAGAEALRFRGKYVNVAGWSGPVSKLFSSSCVCGVVVYLIKPVSDRR